MDKEPDIERAADQTQEAPTNKESRVESRVTSRIRFQATGRADRRPTGSAAARPPPQVQPTTVSSVQDEAEEEEYELYGEEEDADEEDGDFDEDFGEEEDDDDYDSEGDEFEELASQEDADDTTGNQDPNREPTARELAFQTLELNRQLYPVYRGILTEVNLLMASGRATDPIAQAELNDTYVGAPPSIRSTKFAILTNPAKDSLLRGEDKLYEADIQLYQVQMCLNYLEQYAITPSDSPKRTRLQAKYMRHVASIDPRLKSHDLGSDLELVKKALQDIVKVRHDLRAAEESKYNSPSGSTILFPRSVQQLFYNSTWHDREYINDLTKSFVSTRQQAYEALLGESGPQRDQLARSLVEPYSSVQASRKADKSAKPGSSQTGELVSVDQQVSEANGDPGRATETGAGSSKVQLRVLSPSPSKSRRIQADQSKLWPVLWFEVPLQSPLEAAFSLLMDTQEIMDYDSEAAVEWRLTQASNHILLHKLVARAFAIKNIDLMALQTLDPSLTIAQAVQGLLTFGNSIREAVAKELAIGYPVSNLDVVGEAIGYTQVAKKVVQSLSSVEEWSKVLEFFKDGEKDLVQICCEDGQTKLLVLFVTLYQRFALIWRAFERVARENSEFDLIKMFRFMRVFVLQGLIADISVDASADPERILRLVFGEFAPQLYNIPLIVKRILKRIELFSRDYIYLDFLEAQMKHDFTIRGFISSLPAMVDPIKPFELQISSYDKKTRKLYIHNLRLVQPNSEKEDQTSVMQEETQL